LRQNPGKNVPRRRKAARRTSQSLQTGVGRKETDVFCFGEAAGQKNAKSERENMWSRMGGRGCGLGGEKNIKSLGKKIHRASIARKRKNKMNQEGEVGCPFGKKVSLGLEKKSAKLGRFSGTHVRKEDAWALQKRDSGFGGERKKRQQA